MQTRCPHCETLFRVTDSQLASAYGYVRCGVCEEVFNVYSDDGSLADETSTETVLADETIDENAVVQESAFHDPDDQVPTEDGSIELRSDLSESESITEDSEDNLADDSLEGYEDSQPEDIEYEKLELSEQTDELTTGSASEDRFLDEDFSDDPTRQVGHSVDSASPSEKKYDDSYDLFDDRDDSRDHVVPEEFRSGYGDDHSSTLTTVLWSTGILFLIATLFLEYIWFNRDDYARIPQVQAEIEKLCQQFDCDDISLRVPDRIELVSRNVYSHPNNNDGLIVDITMKNNAAFAQPYPVLKIEFSNIRGKVIASRNFLPREYLSIVQQNTESVATLPPDTSSSITLEVKDPGEQAMTYEFEFL
jgi:predicted Zn finger-like uncharacterized protein